MYSSTLLVRIYSTLNHRNPKFFVISQNKVRYRRTRLGALLCIAASKGGLDKFSSLIWISSSRKLGLGGLPGDNYFIPYVTIRLIQTLFAENKTLTN